MSELEIVSGIQAAVTSTPVGIAVAVFLARWLVLGFGVFGIVFLMSRSAARRHAVREAAWSAALALALTTLISAVIGRLRPYMLPLDTSAPVTLFIPEPLNASFPSGHTGVSFAIASALFAIDRRLGLAALFIALFVALGRVAVGVHFPSDIIGGVAVGIGSYAAVRHLHHRIRTRDLDRAAKKHRHA
ncbi:phosphatase PAP2 family protein [Patescibacteria group bacterium]|nr:phosphatase PAP2 family protein [Patescibacteria group bacterium]